MSSLRAHDPPQQRISGDERDFVTTAEPLQQPLSAVFGLAEPFRRGELLRHDRPVGSTRTAGVICLEVFCNFDHLDTLSYSALLAARQVNFAWVYSLYIHCAFAVAQSDTACRAHLNANIDDSVINMPLHA